MGYSQPTRATRLLKRSTSLGCSYREFGSRKLVSILFCDTLDALTSFSRLSIRTCPLRLLS